MPALTAFMHRYPTIELDVDFSDRLVDVIEEGFDAVVRTGEPTDSRLMSRPLGTYRLLLVASPGYLSRHGTPRVPADLAGHACLQHKFPSTGKFEAWPLKRSHAAAADVVLPATMVCNTSEALLDVAKDGLGIACLPDFMVSTALELGELTTVLDKHIEHQGTFRLLWPSSKHRRRNCACSSTSWPRDSSRARASACHPTAPPGDFAPARHAPDPRYVGPADPLAACPRPRPRPHSSTRMRAALTAAPQRWFSARTNSPNFLGSIVIGVYPMSAGRARKSAWPVTRATCARMASTTACGVPGGRECRTTYRHRRHSRFPRGWGYPDRREPFR